jgi:hypothetical protein
VKKSCYCIKIDAFFHKRGADRNSHKKAYIEFFASATDPWHPWKKQPLGLSTDTFFSHYKIYLAYMQFSHAPFSGEADEINNGISTVGEFEWGAGSQSKSLCLRPQRVLTHDPAPPLHWPSSTKGIRERCGMHHFFTHFSRFNWISRGNLLRIADGASAIWYLSDAYRVEYKILFCFGVIKF